jgi:hypothetical protein
MRVARVEPVRDAPSSLLEHDVLTPDRPLVGEWQHFGNSHIVRSVRRVQKAAQNGRSGRCCTYLRRMYEVEGLVDFTVRGGSNPLGRTRAGSAPQ